MNRLENGQPFPAISAPSVDAGDLHLPDDLGGRWAVVLFYRGHW